MTATQTVPQGSIMPGMEPVGFVAALHGREDAYPLLNRALLGASDDTKAMRERIEWTKADGATEFNYTEILRTPYGRGGHKEQALLDHLATLEDRLKNGEREFDTSGVTPLGRMGGVRFLLGRDLYGSDRIVLHPLRDLVHFEDRLPGINEWLSEVTLEVCAAA